MIAILTNFSILVTGGSGSFGQAFVPAAQERLSQALKGIGYVVHAAAMKIVPTAEYNPFECVKTNAIGAINLIDACFDRGVKRVAALSTDKATAVRPTCMAPPS